MAKNHLFIILVSLLILISVEARPRPQFPFPNQQQAYEVQMVQLPAPSHTMREESFDDYDLALDNAIDENNLNLDPESEECVKGMEDMPQYQRASRDNIVVMFDDAVMLALPDCDSSKVPYKCPDTTTTPPFFGLVVPEQYLPPPKKPESEDDEPGATGKGSFVDAEPPQPQHSPQDPQGAAPVMNPPDNQGAEPPSPQIDQSGPPQAVKEPIPPPPPPPQDYSFDEVVKPEPGYGRSAPAPGKKDNPPKSGHQDIGKDFEKITPIDDEEEDTKDSGSKGADTKEADKKETNAPDTKAPDTKGADAKGDKEKIVSPIDD